VRLLEGSQEERGVEFNAREGSKNISGLCTLGYVGTKNIRTGEAAPVKRGDRQPVRQSLVVP
jgi:hypothetical protein